MPRALQDRVADAYLNGFWRHCSVRVDKGLGEATKSWAL
ncbi:hypothetical protein PAMC26577_33245 [Caballeronia sordidicola]|uniref:Uncharacterized protein n=1 Tax=Caballeronia sordidicola TaxID=196367 RepID=A0A242MBI1_CABSO|nr:hypothetical protein PAMC26577_33245 [Caballeronia sordidicola]